MPAGFMIRLGASILDAIIVGIPIAILMNILFSNEESKFFTQLLSFFYSLLLPIVWKGFTVGKRICGIRIRKLDESSPDLITMLLRNVLGGLFYGLTFGVGFIISICMVLIRTDNRAMHDLIARTEVVYK